VLVLVLGFDRAFGQRALACKERHINEGHRGNGYQSKEQSRLRGRVRIRVRLGKRAGIQDGDIREIDRNVGKLLLGKRLY
jgi:hypothetical protein